MKSKIVFIAVFIIISGSSFFSCTDESNLVTPDPLTLDLSGATTLSATQKLGRVLFYDTHLSVNNSISCASCHKQGLAFSDNKAFSNGFENRLTSRNTIPIQNLDMFGGFTSLFWDGREENLTTMVLMPIVNHVEMGMENTDALVERVRNVSYYHDLFEDAYGYGANISAINIANALSSFVSRIISFNSRFDLLQQDPSMLNALEKQGEQLFFDKYNCRSCHVIESGNGGGYGTGGEADFVNIGLDVNYTDAGRENVTNNPADAGKFRIPNLRNVAITAPYMHDGRFSTLDEVLNFYSHNITNHANLDTRLKNESGMPMQMNITDQEKTALIAFLGTFTDHSMISNHDLSNPFH